MPVKSNPSGEDATAVWARPVPSPDSGFCIWPRSLVRGCRQGGLTPRPQEDGLCLLLRCAAYTVKPRESNLGTDNWK